MGCPSFCKIFSTQLFSLSVFLQLSSIILDSHSEGYLSQSLTHCGLVLLLRIVSTSYLSLITLLISTQLGQVLTAQDSLLVPN